MEVLLKRRKKECLLYIEKELVVEEFGNIARAVSRKAEREDKVYP